MSYMTPRPTSESPRVRPDTTYNPSLQKLNLKRRLYIIGSAFGVILSVLYAISTIHEGINAAFVFSMAIMFELVLFFVFFVFSPQSIVPLELLFHFGMVGSLLLLGEFQLQVLYARGVLNPDKLGFLINSLVMWLTLFHLGAFLALPFRQVRQLLIVTWSGIALLAISAAVVMRPPEEWRYSYLISWIAGLLALCMVSLQITWLGRRQQYQATTDALTGVANRHLLVDKLKHHYQQTVAHQRSFTVLLIDIDHFKSINDSYGHAVGDHVLKAVATAILQHIHASDQVGRWGGDEFLVLLADSNISDAQQIAEQIRSKLERDSIATHYPVTISIGMHQYHSGQSIDQIIACADQALYAAKQSGRNQIGAWSQN